MKEKLIEYINKRIHVAKENKDVATHNDNNYGWAMHNAREEELTKLKKYVQGLK